MPLRPALISIVQGLSRALGGILRLGRAVTAPAVRLGHLAALQSRVAGTVPATTQFDGPVECDAGLRLELGPACRFGRRVYLETTDAGVIRLGAGVRINAGCFVVAYSEVSIGRDTLIGEYVSIRDADHGVEPGALIREQAHQARPIRIGEGVWIGRGAVILKGVTIGDGAVVAANSVVTRDVRAMAIVAGIPAKELRTRDGASPRRAAEGAGPRAKS